MIQLCEIMQNAGIEVLTPMQEAMLKAYHTDRNIVLLSPTGSGKTLAFLLPLVMSLNADKDGVQTLVLTPSRELALQIDGVFRSLGTPFKAMSCYGGRSTMEEHRIMNNLHPSVIIATPGRINDHLKKNNIDASAINTLVIDEFDKCLELGFQDEMSEVVTQLTALQKKVLLSATEAVDIPDFVAGTGNRDVFLKLDFLDNSSLSARLDIQKVLSPEKDKLETLYRLLCAISSNSPTLVFVNYRESVERVASFLHSKRFSCGAFHGGMEQIERERALYKFRNGTTTVLVSTDLAARGLDIDGVVNVVHYHLPVTSEAFTHRNGRTARWAAKGHAYIILHQDEELPAYLSATKIPAFTLPIQVTLPPPSCWTTLYIGKGKKDKVSKADVVGFLYKKGGMGKDDVGQVDVKDHYSFAAVRRDKLKKLMVLIRGEKIKGMKTIVEEAR